MQTLENFFLNTGLSWTLSKLFPYIVCVLLGLLLMYIFLKLSRKAARPVRIIVALILLITPFIIGFSTHPIYTGDFSNNSTAVTDSDNADLQKDGLVVITIPGCPYCLGTIPKLKKIKERYPQIPIRYVVCTSDASNLESLREEADGKFEVEMARDKQALAKVTSGTFPGFVMVESGKPVCYWSNDNFGVRAIDKVESTFAKHRANEE